MPRLPPNNVSFGLFVSNDLKQSGLWICKELAETSEDEIMALCFWDLFFKWYFKVDDSDRGFFPKSDRSDMNKLFMNKASVLESADPELAKIYFSYTTWSEEVILYIYLIISQ